MLIKTNSPFTFAKNRGIALVQVLLLTAIIAVYCMYISASVKMQIQQAQWAKDKAHATVNGYSAEARVLYQLLVTNKGTKPEHAKQKRLPFVFNFYGKPEKLGEQITVTMQDHSGLLQLHFPNVERLTRFMEAHLGDRQSAVSYAARLLDWQDTDNITRDNGAEQSDYLDGLIVRNGPIQDLSELSFIGLPNELVIKLKRNASFYKIGAFNPYNATEPLLRTMFDHNQVEQIVAARNSGLMTQSLFKTLTGFIDEDNSFIYISNFQQMTIESRVGQAVYKKQMIFQLSPYAELDTLPVNVLEQKVLN